MDRPRSASWMIPLMVAYSVFSAGLTLLAFVDTIFSSLPPNDPMPVSILFMIALWFGCTWVAIGFVSVKPWAARAGVIIFGIVLVLSIVGAISWHFEWYVLYVLITPSVAKLVSIDLFLRQLPISNTTFIPGLVYTLPIIDATIAGVFLWFCRSRATRDWIAAAQESQPED